MILKREEKDINGVKIENLLHESQNVIKTSYNYDSKQLFVTFYKGGVYYYNDVSSDTYRQLTEASSVGSFINKNLVKKYTTIKQGDMTPENLNLLKEEISNLIKEKNN